MKNKWNGDDILDDRETVEPPLHQEILSAFEELFPELDPHQVMSEFRKSCEEQRRRVRQLFH